MTRNLVTEELQRIMSPCEWSRVFFGSSKSKIEACNANMNDIDYPWDIVVLVSDDMIPQIKGYDDVIRNHMLSKFPDTNGILWFNDGCQADKLNTLCIFGRKMYESFGYIYHPSYKSLFCDTELTDACRTTLADKCSYSPYCIIRHEHPGTGFAQNMDGLYQANQRFWSTDMYNYISRKSYAYDWSILIPTMMGRDAKLTRLLTSIREKISRICPELRIDINLAYDNRETSVGIKRDNLLQGAKGKYVCFIDDDDEITDNYIEDIKKTIEGNYHVMKFHGIVGEFRFTHSVSNKLSDPMARGNEFLRPPNHLNPMMTDVAKLVRFNDAQRGEDLDWTMRMAKTGMLTNEYVPDFSRVHYIYNAFIDPRTLDYQKSTTYDTLLKMVWTSNGAVAPTQEPAKTPGGPSLRLGPKGFVSK